MRWMVRFRDLVAIVVLLGVTLLSGCVDDPPGYRPSYRGAHYLHKERVTFDDGDTIEYAGRTIRILGMDTPETLHPEVGIFENQPCGPEASDSAEALIRRARVAEYLLDGTDYYGRTLGHIFVDGELLSVKLIEMGLAYETVSHYGDNGFPELAQRILNASLAAPKPKFQKPYLWRKKHQKKPQ